VLGAPTLAEIYAQYGRSVYRRALCLLGDEAAAQDATHEVFLRMMKAGETQFDAGPMAWLYRVTTNLCLNSLRDGKRQGAILSRWKPEDAAPIVSGDEAEARIAVRRILEQVPSDLQEIAIYYYVDELSHDEIATIVGTSRRTIGNRLAMFHALTDELLEKEAQS
jgi:RNA polymerase sigma-70 factor (ECF subfamily)